MMRSQLFSKFYRQTGIPTFSPISTRSELRHSSTSPSSHTPGVAQGWSRRRTVFTLILAGAFGAFAGPYANERVFRGGLEGASRERGKPSPATAVNSWERALRKAEEIKPGDRKDQSPERPIGTFKILDNLNCLDDRLRELEKERGKTVPKVVFDGLKQDVSNLRILYTASLIEKVKHDLGDGILTASPLLTQNGKQVHLARLSDAS